MHLVKTSITLPDDLLQEAKSMSKNVSGLITDALRDYLRQRKIEKAMQAFGGWQEREGESLDIVNESRKEGERKNAASSC